MCKVKEVKNRPYGKSITVILQDGTRYETVNAFCAATGINPSTASRWAKRGYTFDEMLLRSQGKSVDHLGNRYRTQGEMCAFYGVSQNLYSKRRSRGWTIEEALTGVRRKEQAK